MVGLEYELTGVQDPSFYVIRKQMRVDENTSKFWLTKPILLHITISSMALLINLQICICLLGVNWYFSFLPRPLLYFSSKKRTI